MTEAIIAFIVFIGVMGVIGLVLYAVTKISEMKDRINEKKLKDIINIYEEEIEESPHSIHYHKDLEDEYHKVAESDSFNKKYKE